MVSESMVTLSINGQSVQAEKGRLLIDVAEEMGVFVPRFCYHPGMKSVAVCRMCLVQVEGQRKLLPACATPVDEGMNVNTVDEQAVDAQRGMLEFLLINHPLDCPICDRGGECPLQDQTYQHGPGGSRYVEPKRTYEKALEISNLVVLDRERCVLCWRCVRFCEEISGDAFIQLVDRGAGTQILTFADEPFDSYFSGNTIQICPVGALTSKPYRFVSRPWDLETAPSVCSYCAVGCPITNESRADKMVRCQALPNENVNDFWICDKGRFGYHFVSSPDRLATPLVRGANGEFEQVGWSRAVAAAAERLKGKDKVGVIAGGHLPTEDAFALSRLARKVIGTPHIDGRIQDAGAPYDSLVASFGAAGSTATLNDLESASTILWIGDDPKETLPVLYLRLRKAVHDNGAQLVVASARPLSLDAFAAKIVRGAPDDLATAIAQLDGELGDEVVVCWGPSSPGRDESDTAEAAFALARSHGKKLLLCVPHAGSQGLLDMGIHPALGPAYEPAPTRGDDTRAMLEAAAEGKLDALLIVGADLVNDFPDAQLVRRALESKVFVVVVELLPTATVSYADVVFPATAYAEREATLTNLERRLQKLEPLVDPPGTAREGWRICAALARELGTEWNWNTFDDVWNDLRREVKTHRDLDVAALRQSGPLPGPMHESGLSAEARSPLVVAGPGGQYPKGHRQGAPFQTGQNWPLSWELRAFEAKQRPGIIPPLNGSAGAEESGAEKPGEPSPGAEHGEGEAFILLAARHIYDEGNMVARSAALRGIARRPYLQMNAQDAAERDLAAGDVVTVTGAGTTVELPLEIGDVARGCVVVPFDQQGLHANTLMRGVNPKVEVARQ